MIISAGMSNQGVGVKLERKTGFPHWTAGFFLSGVTEISCAGQSWQFAARSGMILPPFTPYTLNVRKRQCEVWMIFDARPRMQPVLQGSSGAFQPMPVIFRNSASWAAVRAGMQDLLQWWGSQPAEPLLAENAMERILLLACREAGSRNDGVVDDRITRAILHVKNHLEHKITVESLARVAGISPSRFAHLFIDRTGITPMKFLELRRIERAKHLLLTTDQPIQQVAMESGFPNAQHFSIRFRRATGQSPRDLRHQPLTGQVELNPEGNAESEP